MWAYRVIHELGVTPRTAAFIVRLFADENGYNHADEPEIAMEQWSERFLEQPAEVQAMWVRKGLRRLADLDYINHTRFPLRP